MPVRGATTLGSEELRPPPASALYIHFEKSDGDASIRPPATNGPERDSSGRWNYYRQVSLDEKTSTEWRRKIGSKVAEMLGRENASAHYLADWPSGYAFFDHNKQMTEGEMRHDPYLYGSRHTAKFRSTNEFIPHAYWLMTTSTLDNSECACKYCSKKKGQKEVNETVLGAPPKTATTGTNVVKPPPPDQPRKGKGKAKAKPRDVQDSDSTLNPMPQPRLSRKGAKKKPNVIMFPLNIDDAPPPGLYTARKRFTELHGGRLVRDGELIWFRLPTPIYHSGNTGIAINCWPAFAEDIEHRKQVIRDKDNSASFTVKETVYIVTRPLMSGTAVVKVSESSILPFRAWEIDEALVDIIKGTSFLSDLGLTSESAVFDPHGCMGELRPGVSFQRAAPYFAMAVQTAAHMDLYWSPMFQVGGVRGRSASFQGLWLGAERIWRDDVIRILPNHKELVSHSQLARQLPQPFEGSETRPILMRINDISVDDILTLDGPRKVCRVSGSLFCTVPDPRYTINPNDSHMLSPPETNAISGIKNGFHFPFPIPPLGFQYRALTADDQEVVLDANMIAGRYYPRLFLSNSLDMTWMQNHRPQWWLSITAMSGLALSEFSRSNAQYLMRQRADAAGISEAAAISDFSNLMGASAE